MNTPRSIISIATLTLALTLTGCSTTTRVGSTPAGASVYLDGEFVGTTPFVHYDRGGRPSRHRLQVELEGHRSEEFFIDRELAIIYALGAGAAGMVATGFTYGMSAPLAPVPLLWAWWMPGRLQLNLVPLDAEQPREPDLAPAEPIDPPPPPPAPPPPPPPAPPAPEAGEPAPLDQETESDPTEEAQDQAAEE